MANVRQSTIGTAEICAHRLTWDLNPDWPYRTGIVRALGTAVHAAHEAYYTIRMDRTPTHATPRPYIDAAVASLDDEIARAGDGFDWVFQPKSQKKPLIVIDRDESIKMITDTVTNYHQRGCWWPFDWEVLAVEHRFLLPLPGKHHMATGTTDLILRDPGGCIWGVDHKTAKDKPRSDKFSPHKTPQAAYYTWAIGEVFDTDKVAFAYDVMVWGGDFYRIEEHRTPGQVSVTLDKANMVGDLIEAGGPYLPNPSSFLCSQAYCDHWDYCPFGKVLH